MTKLPSDAWDVEGVPGPKYKVGPKCSHPDCDNWADHAHHLFRRSFLASQNMDWVLIPDGEQQVVTANLAALCHSHHLEVTENRAWIRWQYSRQRYAWWDKIEANWVERGDLYPQPEILGQSTFPAKASEKRDDDMCPSCRRRLNRAGGSSFPRLPRRQRKSWLVSVPDDTEDGAAVLDTLVEECAGIFQRQDHHDFRYFTLVQAMTLLLQDQQRITNAVDDRTHTGSASESRA